MGHWSDYYVAPKKVSSKEGEGGAGGSSGGGSKEADRCAIAIADAVLEDVGRCEFYTKRRSLPLAGYPVEVAPHLVGGRVAVRSIQTQEVLGYLPTTFNYLRLCLERGFSYSGKVTRFALGPVPQLNVDLESA